MQKIQEIIRLILGSPTLLNQTAWPVQFRCYRIKKYICKFDIGVTPIALKRTNSLLAGPSLKFFMALEIEGSDFFTSQFKEKTFYKNQIITDFGHIEDYLYFLEKGIVRFVVLKNEEEMTFDFSFEGEFFSAYSSFLTREPSRSAIITLTEVKCYAISYDKLQKVYVEAEDGEKIGRIAAEKLFIKKTEREMDLLTLNPEEKYKKLLSAHPHFIRLIPLKYLASYLGMAPETLSRVRRRIS